MLTRKRYAGIKLRASNEFAIESGMIGNFPTGCRFAPRCPIAKPECSNAIPELVEVEPQRWVRCPYWETNV